MPRQISSGTIKNASVETARKKSFLRAIFSRKKIIIGVVILLLVLFGGYKILAGRSNKTVVAVKSQSVKVDKGYEFAALNNQGKTVYATKIKLKIADVEKTNQVIVRDQTFTAKNKKLFLIVNLELKNDASQALNIMPGDLVRLSVDGDEENKFAPDLHNNLVLVSAISTKLDRIGFVIPEDAKKFKLYIGELEGKKDTVSVDFPS